MGRILLVVLLATTIKLISTETFATPIECVFEDVQTLGYTCSVYNVNLTLPRTDVTFFGTHTDGRSNTNVLGIRFMTTVLAYVPNGIFQAFTNLQNLMIDEVGLTQIDPTDFANATRLRRIWASGNSFRHLGARWFSDIPLLANLLLNNNGIENIDPQAFAGLNRLQNLQLENNNLKSLSGKIFADLENLLTLVLNSNQLELAGSDFEGLIRLRQLQIRFNELTELPSDVFWNLPALQVLLLQNNQLELVNNLHFTRNLDLRDIRLVTNNITSVHPRAFEGLQNINFIRMRQNRCINRDFNNILGNVSEVITELAPCFNNFPRKHIDCDFQNYYSYSCVLNSLNIKWEHLVDFRGDHAYGFTDENVFSVVINSSAITFLPNEFFEQFPNLNMLMIQSSRLELLEPLSSCSSLQYFLAPGNRLTRIDATTFAECGELSVIDLSGNSIEFIDLDFLDATPNLKKLYLSGNRCVDRNFDVSGETISEVKDALADCAN